MRKLTIKKTNHLKNRARRELKNRLRRKIRINKIRNFLPKEMEAYYFNKLWPVQIPAPKNFSLVTNPDSTIEFIGNIEKYYRLRQRVFIILKHVEGIDSGAIGVLLSVMDLFKKQEIKFNGDKPDNEQIKKIIHDSGFFDELYRSDRNRFVYRVGANYQIFTQINNAVESPIGLPLMQDVSQSLWGEKRLCRGLQKVMVELMQNTNNHAAQGNNQGQEQWCLMVKKDEENKMAEFVFVDYGIGIFNSLYNKKDGNKWFGWDKKIKSVLGISSEEVVLEKLLNGEVHKTVLGSHKRTRTDKYYRGKGLPAIKLAVERNQISNLFVLSNRAYANVEENDFRLLGSDFSGTFVYWRLCYSNENKVWTIKE